MASQRDVVGKISCPRFEELFAASPRAKEIFASIYKKTQSEPKETRAIYSTQSSERSNLETSLQRETPVKTKISTTATVIENLPDQPLPPNDRKSPEGLAEETPHLIGEKVISKTVEQSDDPSRGNNITFVGIQDDDEVDDIDSLSRNVVFMLKKLDEVEKGLAEHKIAQETNKKEQVLCNWSLRTVKTDNTNQIIVEGHRRGDVEKQNWRSTVICERISSQTVRTKSGSLYHLDGKINEDQMLEKGYSKQLINAFKNGFPIKWKILLQNHFKSVQSLRGKNSDMVNEKKNLPETKLNVKRTRTTMRQKRKESDKPKVKNAKTEKTMTSDKTSQKKQNSSLSKPDFSTKTPPTSELPKIEEVKRSRSGRIIAPPLDYWRGQRMIASDHDDTISIVQSHLEESSVQVVKRPTPLSRKMFWQESSMDNRKSVKGQMRKHISAGLTSSDSSTTCAASTGSITSGSDFNTDNNVKPISTVVKTLTYTSTDSTSNDVYDIPRKELYTSKKSNEHEMEKNEDSLQNGELRNGIVKKKQKYNKKGKNVDTPETKAASLVKLKASEEMVNTDGNTDVPSKEMVNTENRDGNTDVPSKEMVNTDGNIDVPSKEMVNTDGNTDIPSKEMVNTDRNTDVPSKEMVNTDSNTDVPSKEMVNTENRDGNTDVPSEEIVNRDIDVPSEEMVNTDVTKNPAQKTYGLRSRGKRDGKKLDSRNGIVSQPAVSKIGQNASEMTTRQTSQRRGNPKDVKDTKNNNKVKVLDSRISKETRRSMSNNVGTERKGFVSSCVEDINAAAKGPNSKNTESSESKHRNRNELQSQDYQRASMLHEVNNHATQKMECIDVAETSDVESDLESSDCKRRKLVGRHLYNGNTSSDVMDTASEAESKETKRVGRKTDGKNVNKDIRIISSSKNEETSDSSVLTRAVKSKNRNVKHIYTRSQTTLERVESKGKGSAVKVKNRDGGFANEIGHCEISAIKPVSIVAKKTRINKNQNVGKKSTKSQPSVYTADEEMWAEDEHGRLIQALSQVHPTAAMYWQKIAQLVKTRSAEECQLHIQNDKGSKRPTKKVAQKIRAPEKLTAKVGTLARKRQLRDILEQQDDGYEDDLYDSTPFRNHGLVKFSPVNFNDEDFVTEDVDAHPSNQTPSNRTPMNRLRPAGPLSTSGASETEHITPALLKTVNRNEVDRYVHQLKKRKVGRPKKTKSHTPIPKKIPTPRPLSFDVDDCFDIREDSCSETEEDYYWSDV